MNYPDSSFGQPVSESALNNALSDAMRRVYNWMGLGLLVTAVTAVLFNFIFFSLVPELGFALFSNSLLLLGIGLAQIGFVIWLSRSMYKLAPSTALLGFFGYAALNGVLFSVIFLIYDLGTITLALGVTMGLFFALSLFGYVTKINLAKMGGFLLMAVVGLIIASVANFFLANSTLDWIITYAAVVIFSGLAIYHTQRVKNNTLVALRAGDERMLKQVGIWGALALYIDFINLFLNILRILGRRR